jgi:hypothetical protein
MAGKIRKFVSKYHRVGDQHLGIDSNAVKIAATQKQILISISAVALLDLAHVNKGWSTDLDLALKLDMLVVLAVFTFVGAILFGAF